MQNLLIEATKYTPDINFDIQKGILNICGKSYPENTFDYYKPILDWVEAYLQTSLEKSIVLNLDLEYLNSSSLKAYFDLFDIVEIATAKDNAVKIKINWFYDEDNDITQETGEDFVEDFKTLNIELIVKGS